MQTTLKVRILLTDQSLSPAVLILMVMYLEHKCLALFYKFCCNF